MSLPIYKQYYAMKTGTDGINLIKRWEGLRLEAYLCPSGKWTIGYGHTGKEVNEGLVITEAEAEDLLRKDLNWAEAATNNYFTGLNQYEFDAIVSITYNMGAPRFRRTRLCRMIKEGINSSSIDMVWSNTAIRNSEGKKLKGLQNRRKDEAKLFTKML